MNRLFQLIGFAFIVCLQFSCTSYKLQYANREEALADLSVTPSGNITHTLLLIGDAGNATPDDFPPAIALLHNKIKALTDPKHASVVFLGDNIYPNGFASDSESAEHSSDAYRLQAQLDAVKDFSGHIFFIAGNHDWYKWGLSGVQREKAWIESYLGREDIWLPQPGCGDPTEVALEDSLTLVLLDSEWWLENENKHTTINDPCTINTRAQLQQSLEQILQENKDKEVVFAMHHPLFSYGPHGGKFAAIDHLFPLETIDSKLKIPLPVLGSIFLLLRSTIGATQDLANPKYKALRKTLLAAAHDNPNLIFVAGHEHTLQYIKKAQHPFIVSGAGSKRSRVKLGKGSQFAYGHAGITELNFYENGAILLKYWIPEGSAGQLIFQKQIKTAAQHS